MWMRVFFVFGAMKVVGFVAFLAAMQWKWPTILENTALATWLTGLAGVLVLATVDAVAEFSSWVRAKLKTKSPE
jgi:hypothetical protein